MANMKIIPERKTHSRLMVYFWNWITCGWDAKNDQNYHDAQISTKVMCCDPADDVIDTHSSLMAGVALKSV